MHNTRTENGTVLFENLQIEKYNCASHVDCCNVLIQENGLVFQNKSKNLMERYVLSPLSREGAGAFARRFLSLHACIGE